LEACIRPKAYLYFHTVLIFSKKLLTSDFPSEIWPKNLAIINSSFWKMGNLIVIDEAHYSLLLVALLIQFSNNRTLKKPILFPGAILPKPLSRYFF
jgi:hypothetical protein